MTALIVLDAQVNMFDPAAGLYDADGVLARLAALVGRARGAGAPVIFVQHCGGPGDPDEPGTPGWELHSALRPRPGEDVVQKSTPDAFAGTNLAAVLAARGANALVVCGMQTDMCVDATVRRAAAMGYDVTLAADAHSTFDGTLPAAEAIRAANAALAEVAQVQPAASIQLAG